MDRDARYPGGRLRANAEGQIDLSLIGASDPKHAMYVLIPIDSPVSQKTRLVIDTSVEATAWFNGKSVEITGDALSPGAPRVAVVDVPRGSSRLLMRLVLDGRAAGQARLATTIVSDQPVGFDSDAGAAGAGDSGRR